jgi:hypothetical protein
LDPESGITTGRELALLLEFEPELGLLPGLPEFFAEPEPDMFPGPDALPDPPFPDPDTFSDPEPFPVNSPEYAPAVTPKAIESVLVAVVV